MLLNERVQIVSQLVNNLGKRKKDDLVPYREGLEATKKCLDECLVFMSKFVNAKWYKKKVIKLYAYKDTFKELKDKLQKCIDVLNLGVAISADDTIRRLYAEFVKVSERDENAEKQDFLQIEMLNHVLVKQDALKRQIAMIDAGQRQGAAQLLQFSDSTQQEHSMMLEVLNKQFSSLEERIAMIVAPLVELPVGPPKLPVDKNLIIEFGFLQFEKVIDIGSNAVVYAGKLLGNKDVAIKKLKQPTPKLIEELYREATILTRLKGDGTVRCEGVCIREGEECLVMELMKGGSLKAYLTDKDKLLTPDLQKQWALEIAKSMSCVHRQGFLHRDLKTANVLLTKEKSAKLADFDLAIMQKDGGDIKPVAYTSQAFTYMAPELRGQGEASVATDIYSYGVILWEILTRNIAPINKDDSLLKNIVEPYKSIIASCWQKKPQDRRGLDRIIAEIELMNILAAAPSASGAAPSVTKSKSPVPDGLRVQGRELYQQGGEYQKAGRLAEALNCYKQSAAFGYHRGAFFAGDLFYHSVGSLKGSEKEESLHMVHKVLL